MTVEDQLKNQEGHLPQVPPSDALSSHANSYHYPLQRSQLQQSQHGIEGAGYFHPQQQHYQPPQYPASHGYGIEPNGMQLHPPTMAMSGGTQYYSFPGQKYHPSQSHPGHMVTGPAVYGKDIMRSSLEYNHLNSGHSRGSTIPLESKPLPAIPMYLFNGPSFGHFPANYHPSNMQSYYDSLPLFHQSYVGSTNHYPPMNASVISSYGGYSTHPHAVGTAMIPGTSTWLRPSEGLAYPSQHRPSQLSNILTDDQSNAPHFTPFMGNSAEDTALLNANRVKSKEWFDYLLSMAHQKYNSADFQGALGVLQELFSLDPNHLPTLLLLGCTCYSLSLYSLSIYYNNLILQIEPQFAEAYSNLGTTHRALAQQMTKSGSIPPENAAMLTMGLFKRYPPPDMSHIPTDPAANMALAERYYKIAISIRPKYWDASINLAGLLSTQCRWKEAMSVYSAIESAIESEFPQDQRMDLCFLIRNDNSENDGVVMSPQAAAASTYHDGQFIQLLSSVEAKKRKYAMSLRNSGKPIPGESSGFTTERRRDLYFAKGNLCYAMNDWISARQEYLKGLTVVGIDISSFFQDLRSAMLPLPTVTPQQALAISQQKRSSNEPTYHPTTSSILQTLAKIYQDCSFPILAIKLYYLSLSLCPTANTCNNLGILLAQQRMDESIQWYELGLALDPNHVHLYTNLGSALKDRGQIEQGINCYQRAIAMQPDFFIALANLANVFKDLGKVEEAIDLYKRALRVKPDFIEAFCNFVNSLLFICDWENRDSHLETIRGIVEKQLRDGCNTVPRSVPTVLPFHTFTYSSLPCWMVREISRRNAERVFWNATTSEWFPGFPERPCILARELLPWVAQLSSSGKTQGENDTSSPMSPNTASAQLIARDPRLAQKLARSLNYPYPYPVPPFPSPRIHIGYVSSDFTNHPLAHLMQSVFRMHDRSRFHVFCYALTPSDGSPYRQTIEEGADVFLDVSQWNVQQIVERITHVDRIHVLVNLNGYTKGGRNEIFAARPAPIQMALMGFAATMGAGDVNDPEHADMTGQLNLPPAIPVVPAIQKQLTGVDLSFFDTMERRWMDYLIADEIAAPHKFVIGEPLEADEVVSPSTSSISSELRGKIVQIDDRNRMYTEGLIFMPHTYFVNDHRQGFRETDDAELDSILEELEAIYGIPSPRDDKPDSATDTMDRRFAKLSTDSHAHGARGFGLSDEQELGVPKSEETFLSAPEIRLWKKEQMRRLRMRHALFPQLAEDTVIFANFNQLYKIDPDIFKTWMQIVKRVKNSILWLLRFPPAGESYLKKRAVELVGEEVAQRLVFTDVAPKHVHIHRGRIADIFLDTPECNAHTTAADILWSGTPIVTFPKYDFKMCSRVAASVAYATGEWAPSDPFFVSDNNTTPALPGLNMNLHRLQNPNLLGHYMVVNSYQEYEDRAVMLGTSLKWGWTPIPTWVNLQGKLSWTPPLSAATTSAPTSPSATTTTPTTSPLEARHSQPYAKPVTRSTSGQVGSHVGSVFYPSAEHPTHMLVPYGCAATLRRRLFLTRDKMPLFDTPRWVRNFEKGVEMAMEKWQTGWDELVKRNQLELDTDYLSIPASGTHVNEQNQGSLDQTVVKKESRCIWIRE